MSPTEPRTWREPVRTALEAVRIEALRRITAKGLPAAIAVNRLAIIDDDERTGWSSEWRQETISAIRNREVTDAVSDSSVDGRPVGFREQLEPLARTLNEHSDIAARPHPLFSAEGSDAILARYLVPLALAYLNDLPSLDTPAESLLDRLSREMEEFVGSAVSTHVRQIALAGIRVETRYEHRDVLIRPLTEVERGAIVEPGLPETTRRFRTDEFAPGWSPANGASPCTLVEIRSVRPMAEMQDQSTLPQQIALAIFLEGHDIAGLGYVQSFDLPAWASVGISRSPFSVGDKTVGSPTLLTEASFKSIVDLAYNIPPFSAKEEDRKEIVLHRLLRACTEEHVEGFLDFAISLEAALLGVDKNELTYRFKLYGSLFLSDLRDAAETFNKLGVIYDVRSKLVHGSTVDPARLRTAHTDARELAIAVVRKCVEHGWPNKQALDRMALSARLPADAN